MTDGRLRRLALAASSGTRYDTLVLETALLRYILTEHPGGISVPALSRLVNGASDVGSDVVEVAARELALIVEDFSLEKRGAPKYSRFLTVRVALRCLLNDAAVVPIADSVGA